MIICKEYNVTSDWILFGEGSETLTEKEKDLIRRYKNLDPIHQKSVDDMINTWQLKKEIEVKKIGNL